MAHPSNSSILILGAGMAGLATAYHLAVKHHIKNITLVDERPPLGLTSSRGTMAYRNWFPGPGDAMVRLMNRSIDLFEEIDTETNHAIQLTQNGYTYFTANPAQIPIWRTLAQDAELRGVSPFRENPSLTPSVVSSAHVVTTSVVPPSGTTLLTDPATIRALYPKITAEVAALLHVHRCGSFDVLKMGDYLLSQFLAHSGTLLQDRVNNITTRGNRIESVHLASGAEISTDTVVIAAGPLLPEIARMLEIEIPVYNELHAKITLRDTGHVFPRYSDLLLWNDPQTIEWNDTERAAFAASKDTRYLLDEFPGGVHYLPKGTPENPTIMGLWTYDIHPAPFVPVPAFDPHYADLILHGLVRMIPAARVYLGHADQAIVDGGYYCKTRENRPLIGPLPIRGAYIIGALSGFGVMSSQGAAELVSAHIVGAALPDFASEFLLSRYADPAYQSLTTNWDSRSGQL